ncbi:type IV pilus biogenesis/stability protein PilW [Pseudomonas cichorii]|uniref:tetratricopeptide repeat protein n=1 Tax=Pseudomonas cichorii TaxID=36746 RepID=UPI00217FDF03|nr:tetratricopeptide repeat protein [Pseudomonas cichorii]
MNYPLRWLTSTIKACCVFYLGAVCYAEDSRLSGIGGATLNFSSWDNSSGTWKQAVFIKNNLNVTLYDMASASTGFGKNSTSLSPDKNYALIQRTVFGELSDGQKVTTTEKSYCDMISMESGCVLLSRPAEVCSGSWKDSSWATDAGEIVTPKLEAITPKDLLKSTSAIEDVKDRALAIREHIFMGVGSYMGCYPPAKNLQALNDLGFYLAQAGDDTSALKIYRGIEAVGKRAVLMLNIADSLWSLKRTSEAVEYYKQYVEAMSADGKGAKVPVRVSERIK